MPIIGVVGPKQSGKSTVARILGEVGWVEYSFASPLKDICTILGAPHEALHGSGDAKELVIPALGVSGRQLMQYVGTELFREHLKRVLPAFRPANIWLHLMRQRLETASPEECIVISDVRFDDEAELIRRMGGVLLYIKRPSASAATSEHASEDGFKRAHPMDTLENTGTGVDLRQRLFKWLRDQQELRKWLQQE
jgi:hypothetical protein